MLSGLQDEINNHPELQTASKDIIINALNADGTAQTETWAVMSETVKIPKGDILALMSATSISNIIRWMRAESDDNALAFHELYLSHDQFKVTDTVFRLFINLLESLAKITESERDAIMRLGERKISRAEELFNKKLTVEDFA